MVRRLASYSVMCHEWSHTQILNAYRFQRRVDERLEMRNERLRIANVDVAFEHTSYSSDCSITGSPVVLSLFSLKKW